MQLYKGLHQHSGKDSVGLGWEGQVPGEKQKGSSRLVLSKKWLNNQALENLIEVFQQVSLLYLYLHHCFVMTSCSRGSPHMHVSVGKFPYLLFRISFLFLWALAVGPRGRAKVGSKEDTQGGGQVLVLFSLFTAARTEGCVNEEVKGERVLLALCEIMCIWRATTFGRLLEQRVLVQFQKTFRTGTEKQNLLSC